MGAAGGGGGGGGGQRAESVGAAEEGHAAYVGLQVGSFCLSVC